VTARRFEARRRPGHFLGRLLSFLAEFSVSQKGVRTKTRFLIDCGPGSDIRTGEMGIPETTVVVSSSTLNAS
jgi:hypothetical protein